MEQELFYSIIKLVKTKQNYIPRNYQTVGGIWTVDTYKLDDTTVRVMDDGYTLTLVSPNISAVDTAGKFKLQKGTEKDLKELYKRLVTL